MKVYKLMRPTYGPPASKARPAHPHGTIINEEIQTQLQYVTQNENLGTPANAHQVNLMYSTLRWKVDSDDIYTIK